MQDPTRLLAENAAMAWGVRWVLRPGGTAKRAVRLPDELARRHRRAVLAGLAGRRPAVATGLPAPAELRERCRRLELETELQDDVLVLSGAGLRIEGRVLDQGLQLVAELTRNLMVQPPAGDETRRAWQTYALEASAQLEAPAALVADRLAVALLLPAPEEDELAWAVAAIGASLQALRPIRLLRDERVAREYLCHIPRPDDYCNQKEIAR